MKGLVAGCALMLLISTADTANSAIITKFDFDDHDGIADFQDAHVSSTDFLAGNGLVGETFAGSLAASRGWVSASSAPGAVGQAKFWEFTVTANPGRHLNLSSLTFDEFRGSSGPSYFQVQLNGMLIGSQQSTATASTTHSLDLSEFSNLTSATIRMLAWDSANNGSNSNWNVDNVELSGAAVPEPSALLLAVALAPGLAVYRHRKRRGGCLSSAAIDFRVTRG